MYEMVRRVVCHYLLTHLINVMQIVEEHEEQLPIFEFYSVELVLTSHGPWPNQPRFDILRVLVQHFQSYVFLFSFGK